MKKYWIIGLVVFVFLFGLPSLVSIPDQNYVGKEINFDVDSSREFIISGITGDEVTMEAYSDKYFVLKNEDDEIFVSDLNMEKERNNYFDIVSVKNGKYSLYENSANVFIKLESPNEVQVKEMTDSTTVFGLMLIYFTISAFFAFFTVWIVSTKR